MVDTTESGSTLASRNARPFVDDSTILEWLKRPQRIEWTAQRLGTSPARCAKVLEKHKTEILTARVEAHHQTPTQISFQLGIAQHYDSITNWYRSKYG